METLRDTFYAALRSDFDRQALSSLLCRWLAEEKAQDFRLSLKRRQAALRDSPESRRAFGAFLVRSLLEDSRLRPLQRRLESLPPLLRLGPEGRTLRRFLEWLEEPETDLPSALLLDLAAELLERCPRPAERTDAYEALAERYWDLEQGAAGPLDYLKSALDVLLTRKRLGLNSQNRALLESYGLEAGGPDFFAGARSAGEQYRRLRRLLEQPGLPSVDRAGLACLHENLLYGLLMADARTFLYDGGSAGRRKDRTLDLLDYCLKNDPSFCPVPLAKPANDTSGPAEWAVLFQALNRDRRAVQALVPLRLDPLTGAGLYIMGKNHFLDVESVYSAIQGSCCYACFCPDDLAVSGTAGLSFTHTAGPRELPDFCGFSDLQKALDWFNEHRQEPLHYCRDLNGTPPPDCPPALRHCFAAPLPSAEATRKTRARYEEDFEVYVQEQEKRRRQLQNRTRSGRRPPRLP